MLGSRSLLQPDAKLLSLIRQLVGPQARSLRLYLLTWTPKTKVFKTTACWALAEGFGLSFCMLSGSRLSLWAVE